MNLLRLDKLKRQLKDRKTMTKYECEESEASHICRRREIKQPLVVEADHWTKMVDFLKANSMPHLTEEMLKARKKRNHDDGWMVILAKDCRQILKGIGESNE